MNILDITLPTPEENLKFDEDLLNQAESGQGQETLRFWESPTYFVVLGISNKHEKEVHPDCPIPVLRRCSGGGSVVQGPGCLNYSLILDMTQNPELQDITKTNNFILNQLKTSLLPIVPGVQIKGQSDLTTGNKKFSGNAQRRKRHFLLFHGTLLLNFDLDKIPQYLQAPPKQPEYRQNRSHLDFVTNLHLDSALVKKHIATQWQI